MSVASADPQSAASDPRASVFVAANAGSGKTWTLVQRVARLLLTGARPEAMLCVTYTKAAAAEMQRRLFDVLGRWAITRDEPLREALAAIGEPHADLSRARALFARALETPGGLKIQTIHAFCEALLRRFPLEAGISPGFTVLDGTAAAELSRDARESLAEAALARPDDPLGRAYAHLSVELDWASFEQLLGAFEARRAHIAAYAEACERRGGYMIDVWRRCGFPEVESVEAIGQEALAEIRWGAWRRAEAALQATGKATDATLARLAAKVVPGCAFQALAQMFHTAAGEPRGRLGTQGVDADVREWLAREQARIVGVCERLRAAKIAEDTVHVLTLARAYGGFYEGGKEARRALDFGDLIARTHDLLTRRADAAWVLFKLDGGLDHVLLDEAQDTAPEQWAVLEALTDEFFAGAAADAIPRTIFCVGDEKQSIFSFQGAAPERLAAEASALGERAVRAGRAFRRSFLMESFRSTPQVLALVDEVFADPQALAGITPGGGNVVATRPRHAARRTDAGCADLWPLEAGQPAEPLDWWEPVDAEPPASPVRALAARIAREIALAVARGDAVGGRNPQDPARPCRHGDFLILVRRRNRLFEEVIRALKRRGVPVAGADRLQLAQHGAFDDLMAAGRIARFPHDDLTLAALLRGPFCEVSEESLFDLAWPRQGSLWGALQARAAERADWAGAAALVRELIAGRDRAPFEVYARLLNRLDGAGRSMRQRLLTRLGAEAEQALDAFVDQTLEAEGRGVRDLERFLIGLSGADILVKREAEDAGADAVRVMTVHGAKGLEAPIVILPDTTTRASWQGEALIPTEDGVGFLFAPRKGEDCPASTAARLARERQVQEESARLLYVALTRARDRLVVAGVETQAQYFDGSWYDLVRRAFGRLPTRPVALAEGGEAQRFGSDPPALGRARPSVSAEATLPAFASGAAPPEPVESAASPSRLAGIVAGASPSPLARVAGLGRFRRGELIHRLLERLPEAAPADRAALARRSLARELDLDDAQRREIAAAALAVLGDPRFVAVFGPGSRPEVAIAGRPPGLGVAVSGRVDRLLVAPDRVLIVDFKTNRPAPPSVEAADPAYVLQLALYRAVLAQAWPDRPVEAALVWTDGPELMPVPAEAMEAALASLGLARPQANSG